ncbi:RTA1-domain-containing protein [Trametes coccinea BRFM310]|uniref:RTA1-domain-containing protein n=1 Tax=Trametes coccinea (strain BRFM310) TaxID=1353009 RepID=A0A1Y2IFX2_TRAC3|nr:RTA1-domain-containing protein [Trametes coccinea BRFM310]
MATPSSSAVAAAATTRGPQVGHFNPYGYDPTKWICILFVVLFALSTVIHIGQALRSRLWWLLPTACLAGVGEIIGWVARLISSSSPNELDPYLIQITTTIIAPTPLIAANFVILGEIIRRVGPDYSRLSSGWYTIIFLSCDIIALVIQAIGGAKASLAVENGNDPGPGGNIMLAGVAFQLAALVIYVVLASEFLMRYAYDHPFKRRSSTPTRADRVEKNTKLMICGLALGAIFLFIRSIYRVAELSNGWRGKIITTEVYFNVFDGAMITLAMFTMNAFHPGVLIGHAKTWKTHGHGAAKEDKESNIGLQEISH